MGCCRCWKAPNIKDAYRLTVASLVITLLTMILGLSLYRVRAMVDGLADGLAD
jgi:hypothetical protein